jgi:glycosyltransferase involved in cell wall biosynthesis
VSELRVLHIMLGRNNGGAETYCADAIEALDDFGVSQVVAYHPQAARLPGLIARGVPTLLTASWQALPGIAPYFIKRGIAKHRPDLIHCWMRRAAEAAPKTDLPTIGWFGGYYDVKRFVRCGHFIGVTPDIVEHMIRSGVAPERATYVHTFSSAVDPGVLRRSDFQTPESAKVLLILSRLHQKKGIDVAIRALVDLPDHYLWIAGDGELDGSLKAQAAGLGVSDRCRFLGWRDDRGALLRACDICLLPSRYEPFGTVMIEAWAAGRPLIAAAAAGPSRVVRDGVDGLLTPVDDVPALARAIRQVSDEPGLRQRMVAAAAERYRNEYSRERTVADLLAVYRRLAGK